MKKGVIAGIIMVILVAGATLSLSAFAGKPKEYNIEAAKYEAIAESIEVSGDIKGEESTTYYADVTAPISEYRLKVGDVVAGNEVVLQYDTEDLQKILEEAVLTAQSTENSMNGQIATSNKNAALYNKAVEDTNTYMGLYAVARGANDQITQEQYQENWNIGEASRNINTGMAANGVSIADLQIQQSQINEEMSKNGEMLTALGNAISSLDISDSDYKKKYDALRFQADVIEQKNAQLSTSLTEISTSIAQANKSVASGKESLAALPQTALNPEEKAQATANGNWMEDITRNWTEATTIKNTYEGQILNSYQKEQLQNSYDLSELNVINAQDNIEKAMQGVSSKYNGVVTASYVDKGSVVAKGTPLFTVESSDNLKVSVGVSKYDIGKVAVGQNAVVSIAGRKYDATVSEIKRLAQVTDSDKAKVEVSVHINAPDEYVYLGLEADVTIFTNEVEKALVIPADGYYADDAGDYCYVIRQNIIEKQYITIGVESDEYIEVLSGINAGDAVITDAITDDNIGGKAVAK